MSYLRHCWVDKLRNGNQPSNYYRLTEKIGHVHMKLLEDNIRDNIVHRHSIKRFYKNEISNN